MTNEEAIRILKANVMVACDTSDKVGYDTPLNKAIEQALEMAIKALEKEPCGDSISRQSVIKEILRLWNSGGDKDYCMETLRDFVSELPPVTSIYEKLKCTPKEMTHEERVLIELTRDMPKEMGVLYIQSFQQEHGPFTDEAAEIIREYLSKE